GYNEAVFGLREAQTNYDRAVLRAPFSGKVASINASLFETPSAEFCTLVDDRSMRVRFSILESEISLVRVGQGVQIIPFNDSQKQYQGKIESINPIVEDKGQILITAIISNTGGSLIDGQNVKILIEDAVADQLVVPKSAVVVRDNQDVLFRLDNSRALWTYVNIVMANSQEYVVSANLDRGADLNVGDTIIISGNLNLGDGAQVQVVD
ncbi:MAG: HlyD family efflux transporter periplasmic adaptor subunit, partial [Rikenellaceae bacterium]